MKNIFKIKTTKIGTGILKNIHFQIPKSQFLILFLELMKTTLIVLSFSMIINSCSESDSKEIRKQDAFKPVLLENGKIIKFQPGNPGLNQITSTSSVKANAQIPVLAPGRVVSSVLNGTDKNKIVLFESTDITSLYSSYRQNKQNMERTEKNLARTKDMFENHAVTGKDMNDAETDAANAKSALSEMEGRLRAAGYNPQDIENSSPGTIWVISDVPESQLKEVQHGERVNIKFDSYPNAVFHGNVSAIGDVIDPVTRTIKVRVIMRNPPVKLMPGMFCRVDFGNPIDAIILLPLSAIVTVDGKDFIFVETSPGVFERRQVITTNSGQDNIIVLSGLKSGEKAVTVGTMLLKGLSFGF